MDYSLFIADALLNYDKNTEEFQKKIKQARYILFFEYNDIKKFDKIMFFDEDKKFMSMFNYGILGTYFYNQNVWIWSWATIEKTKNTKIARELLKFGSGLEVTDTVKSHLINSKTIISDPLQIDIQLSIASSLSKQKNIFPFIKKFSNNNNNNNNNEEMFLNGHSVVVDYDNNVTVIIQGDKIIFPENMENKEDYIIKYYFLHEFGGKDDYDSYFSEYQEYQEYINEFISHL